MAKYIKESTVVEAFKWTGDNQQHEDPTWIIEAINNKKVWFNNKCTEECKLIIKTSEGTMTANRGDYIVKGVNNELHPCNPDIFEKIYEKVE